MSLFLIEEMWFGDFADDTAEKAAANSMVAMAAEVYGVQPFPAAAQRLITLTSRAEFDIAQVVKTIESDPALASRVLRTINSAAYQLPSRVAAVQRAVTLLGARNVSDIAVGICVLNMFAEGPGPAAEVREHSQRVAAIARFLAMQCRLPADDVYTCALLHDIGKLLFLQVQEAEYRRLSAGGPSGYDAVHLAERAAFGFDHAILAGHVLDAWGLPEPVPQAVAWHHHPARALEAGGQVARLVSLIRIADRLSYELLDQQLADDDLIAEICRNPSAEYLRLSVERLGEIWDDSQLVNLEGRPSESSAQDPAAEARARSASGRCAQCNDAADRGCPRCGQALCEIHLPPLDRRCPTCESEYRAAAAVDASAEERLTALRLGAALALLPLLVLFFKAPAMRWLWVVGALALGPMLTAPSILRRRSKRHRRAFLQERAAADRPPLPESLGQAPAAPSAEPS